MKPEKLRPAGLTLYNYRDARALYVSKREYPNICDILNVLNENESPCQDLLYLHVITADL